MTVLKPTEFARAAYDIQRMLVDDRKKLLDILPQIAKKEPIFAKHAGKQFANDADESIKIFLIGQLGELAKIDPETWLDVAQYIAENSENISSQPYIYARHMAKQIPLLAEIDFNKAMSTANYLLENKSDLIPELPMRLASELGKLAVKESKTTESVKARTTFDLIDKIIANDTNIYANANARTYIIEQIPQLIDLNKELAFQAVENIIYFSDDPYIKCNNFIALVKHLPTLAAADAHRGFAIMESIYAYKGIKPERKPDAPGTLTVEGDNPNIWVREAIVNKVGDIAIFNKDLAFNFINKLIDKNLKANKHSLACQIPLLAKADINSTWTMIDKLSEHNTDHEWRYFADGLTELSRISRSKRLYPIIEDLINNGDEVAVNSIYSNIKGYGEAKFKGVPQVKKDSWIDMIAQRKIERQNIIDNRDKPKEPSKSALIFASNAKGRILDVVHTMDLDF